MIRLIKEDENAGYDKTQLSSELKKLMQLSGCSIPRINFSQRSITLIFNIGSKKHPVDENDTTYITDCLEDNGFSVLKVYTTTGIGSPEGWGSTDIRISIANPLYSNKVYKDQENDIINKIDSICGTYEGILIKESQGRFAYLVPMSRSNDGYISAIIYRDIYTYRMDDFEEYEQYCDRITKDISISWLLKRIVKPIEILSSSEMESLYYNNRDLF